MSTRSISRASIILLVSAVSFLAGCEILEDSPGTDSSSRNRGSFQQPNPQPQRVLVGYNAVLEITRFACHDGEEDDYVWSSGQDEITFIYTILETDQNGWAVRSSSIGWGPFDIHAGEIYNSQYFDDPKLSQIPLGHGLLVTLSIVEIEDYSKAQRTIGTINKYARYVQIANMFNPEPYSKTAIEIVGDILYYSEIALDFISWADGDDVLADQVDVGHPNAVHSTLLSGGQLGNGWIFTGRNNTDDFKYEVSYVVHLQPIYR